MAGRRRKSGEFGDANYILIHTKDAIAIGLNFINGGGRYEEE